MGIIIKNSIRYGDFVSQEDYTIKMLDMLITNIESSTVASSEHLVNTYFMYDKNLYITTEDITIGSAIIPNNNCQKVTICGELFKKNGGG